jgi:hypothetical protein
LQQVERCGRLIIMIEIDFLPEWYDSNRRRQLSFRTQYLALGCAVVVMVVWHVAVVHKISRTRQQLASSPAVQTQSASDEFARLKNQVAELRIKAEQIEALGSRIDVPAVIGELSFLIDEKMVFSSLELVAEKFRSVQHEQQKSRRGVRPAADSLSGAKSPSVGNVRFKITIKGVACDAGDVARLVVALEDSAYFREITSSWRNRTIKNTSPSEEFEVSEFEIGCYLGNYRLDGPLLVKETPKGGRT